MASVFLMKPSLLKSPLALKQKYPMPPPLRNNHLSFKLSPPRLPTASLKMTIQKNGASLLNKNLYMVKADFPWPSCGGADAAASTAAEEGALIGRLVIDGFLVATGTLTKLFGLEMSGDVKFRGTLALYLSKHVGGRACAALFFFALGLGAGACALFMLVQAFMGKQGPTTSPLLPPPRDEKKPDNKLRWTFSMKVLIPIGVVIILALAVGFPKVKQLRRGPNRVTTEEKQEKE